MERLSATGPLGEAVEAYYGVLGDGRSGGLKAGMTAVIEMAACAGLPLVPPALRDPRRTTTYGVGELILAALQRGCRHFIIGIGGSATNDGGAGMLQALGIALLTEQGAAIARGGSALATLAHIETGGLDPRLRACSFEVACDVSNPLCGPNGASAVYGPQKGATPAMVAELDAALAHYARIIELELGSNVRDVPGAGAAGGLGAGLLTFLHAKLRPGAQIVLEALHLEERVKMADLVITAEGQLDGQTAFGKSVSAVAGVAQRHTVPVIALAGSLGQDYQVVYRLGVDAVAALPGGPMTLDYAMEHAAPLARDATARALRLLRLGRSLAAAQ
jgi:glycerate kinase